MKTSPLEGNGYLKQLLTVSGKIKSPRHGTAHFE